MKKYLTRILSSLLFISAFHAHSSLAELRVVTDIAPVHGLVERVLEGVSTPSVIIRPGSDPHHYNLRPSEAANIEKADIIFWIGPELTPWLETALDNLAGHAEHISLLDVKGVHLLTGGHHHGHDDRDEHKDHDDHKGHAGHKDNDDHKDDDDHEEHADHKEHDEHADHDDHKEHDEHTDHDDHKDDDDQALKGAPVDPHAWLDPENAIAWLMVIADEAAHHDPANEALYRKNADSAAKAISEQQARIATILAAKQMPAIFAQHDAYRYFEARFDFALTGALYDKENQAPSPAHIAELHALTHNMAKACLLAETHIENNVVQSVFKDTELYTINANPSGVLQSSHDNGFFGLFDVLEEGLKGCAKH